jgi:integrase/recombinase XerD
MNLEPFKDYLKINTGSGNTTINYFHQMNKFFRYEEEFTQESINRYLAQRVDEKVSASTFNQSVKAISQYAKFVKLNVELPSLKKDNKRVRTFITLTEMEEDLIPMFPMLFRDYQKRELVMRFIFFTGLRLNEMTNLKRENIDLEKRTILIKDTKGKKDRMVKFPSQLVKDLKNFFTAELERDNAFNVTKSFIQYTTEVINKELKFHKYVTCHTLRHSFAKHCLKQGMSIEKVQKLLGHADLITTLIYASPTEEEVLEDYDKYIN